jgi:hypothetical protein
MRTGIRSSATIQTTQGARMTKSELVLRFLQSIIWPSCLIFFVLKFQGPIERILPETQFKFTFGGFEIQTTSDEFTQTALQMLPQLTTDQKQTLDTLYFTHPIVFDHQIPDDVRRIVLKPLIHAGLVESSEHLTSDKPKVISLTPFGTFIARKICKVNSATVR